MKKLSNCVLRYQKDVVYELYQLLKQDHALIDFLWSDGVCYVFFYVGKTFRSFPLTDGNTNITELLDTFANTKKKICKPIKKLLQDLKEFCDGYGVTIYSPGVVYIGHHKVLTAFKLSTYELYYAWQHMEYPDDEEDSDD